MNLHLIARGNCIHPLDCQQRLFSSGYWKISPDRAKSLIGQRVYFHKHRNSHSHFGGEIVGFRIVPAGQDDAGRIELHFRLTDSRAGKGVDASGAPWGREKAFMPPAPTASPCAPDRCKRASGGIYSAKCHSDNTSDSSSVLQ